MPKAGAALKEAVALYPQLAPAQFEYGQILYERGRSPSVLSECCPSRCSCLTVLPPRRSGELKGAISCLELVLKDHPANFDVQRVCCCFLPFLPSFPCPCVCQLLGNFYSDAGDFKRARTLLKKVGHHRCVL